MKGRDHIWPGGKRRALTFSWDDGVMQDRRLLELMRRYGLRGTFNLNSATFGQRDSLLMNGIEVDHSHIAAEEVSALYAGQEVAVHTRTHPHLTQLRNDEITEEIFDDRTVLEFRTGAPVRGMAYPFGDSDARVQAIALSCGMRYARGVQTTGNFALPQNPMDWACTCHYRDMEKYIDAFLSAEGDGGLFSVWGHSYELDPHDEWAAFERQLARLGGHEDVWYATNIEVFDFIASID